MKLPYSDTVTIVSITTTGYGDEKVVNSYDDVTGTFLQGVGYSRNASQEVRNADAVFYPNPTEDFVVNNYMRLEGMYIIANFFGGSDDNAWYRITSCVVNRDHLLDNEIDNIECGLKKVTAIPGVS